MLKARRATSSIISKLKEAQGYKYIVAHFFDTIVLGLFTAALAVAGLAFDWSARSAISVTLAALVAAVGVGTIMAVALSTYYLYALLMKAAQE